MPADLLSVIESAYRLDGDEASWVASLAEVARPLLDRGLGVVAYTLDRDEQGGRIGPMASSPRDTSLEALARERLAVMPAPVAEVVLAAPVGFAASSEVAPPGMLQAFFAGNPRGVMDVVGVQGLDPSGISAWITAPSTSRIEVRPAERARWQRVAAHLATALRLRRGLSALGRAPLDGAGAIFEADLSVAGLGDGAEAALPSLRAYARDLLRARGRLRSDDPDEAIALWRGLCDGTWSIVEHFDSDGHRYYVAHQNEPAARTDRGLSPREEQVVALAALGHPDKLVAYELGLSESTVSGYLRAAMRKLGTPDRTALIRLALALGAGAAPGK